MQLITKKQIIELMIKSIYKYEIENNLYKKEAREKENLTLTRKLNFPSMSKLSNIYSWANYGNNIEFLGWL